MPGTITTTGCGADQLHEVFPVVPADNEVDPGHAELIRGPLRVAADGCYEAIGVVSVDAPRQLAALVISNVGYRACVEQVDVSGIWGAQPVACVEKPVGQ
jgi:hypothetical protein